MPELCLIYLKKLTKMERELIEFRYEGLLHDLANFVQRVNWKLQESREKKTIRFLIFYFPDFPVFMI